MHADEREYFGSDFEHGGHGEPYFALSLSNGLRRAGTEGRKRNWDGLEGCWKNFAGRRCDQKALRQRFLTQPDGQHGLGSVLRSQHSFS
jgi:hypothetical protein